MGGGAARICMKICIACSHVGQMLFAGNKYLLLKRITVHMNVEIGTEAPIFLFGDYLFQIFSIFSLQCRGKHNSESISLQNKSQRPYKTTNLILRTSRKNCDSCEATPLISQGAQ